MKKFLLLVLTLIVCVIVRAQTTVTLFAGGGLPSTSSTTGYSSSILLSDVTDSIVSDMFERGYAVFDLSTIPSNATITSVVIGFNLVGDTTFFSPASSWNIYGYAGDLSTVGSETILYPDLTAGTSLYTTSWGFALGNQTQPSTGPAVSFVQGTIGTKVTMCFTSGGYTRYVITGESGTATTSGAHAPYLQITYTCPPIHPGPTDTICLGNSATLTDSLSGGVWASSAPGVASITSGGVVSTSTAGTAVISYTLSGCTATMNLDVLNVAGISAPATLMCAGTSATFTDATSGGNWTSHTPAIASVNSSGVVSALTDGSTIISYGMAGCYSTLGISVNGPTAISPSSGATCIGGTTTLTDAVGGGTWSVSNSDASVSGGVVTGLANGTDTIYYAASGCTVNALVTVSTGTSPITPAGAVTICAGTSTTLADASGGGIWASGSTAVATVNATGVVTGITPGNATISYSVGSCYTTKIVTVLAAPSALSPSSGSVCTGSTITLTDAVGGGTWASSSFRATVSGGTVTGIFAGAATISYSIGTCTVTAPITVNTSPAGITPAGAASVCTGSTIVLADATGGGTWSSSSVANATVVGGTVLGVLAGTVNISYTVGSCSAIKVVTVNTMPAAISPATGSVCVGNTIVYSESTGGGVWSTVNGLVATVSGGTVTGVGTGNTTISYTIGTCAAIATVTVNASPAAIAPAGGVAICQGSTTNYTDATGGGVWSSMTPGIATVSVTGVVTGASTGTTNISYTKAGCSVISPVTVDAPVAALSPSSTSVCSGSSVLITDVTPGGIWSSSAPATASVVGGTVTGGIAGTANIIYTVGACSATATVTVNTTPAAISPATATICVGSTTNLTDPTGGGTWSTTAPGVATVSGGGVVNAVSPGSAIISYTLGLCAATATINVSTSPAPVSPSGAWVCVGNTTTLSDAVGGGVWSSTAPGTASVSATGVVTGLVAGNATINYAIGTCNSSATITVDPLPAVAAITGGTSICGTGTTLLSDVTAGGVWGATNTNATVAGGFVTGVVVGTDTITYSVTNTCGTATATVAVSMVGAPSAGIVTGISTLCAGLSAPMSDAAGGGVWSVNNANGTISAGGIFTAVTAGTDSVKYTVTNACGTAMAALIITINPQPVPGTISGPIGVCVAADITLSETSPGGTWGATNTNAGITAGGVVNGAAAGVDTIVYAVTNLCGTLTATYPITINPLTFAGLITGIDSVCPGSTVTLNDFTLGGTYATTIGNASVVAGTGVVTGVTSGIDTIVYTVIGVCGAGSATFPVTVLAPPAPAAITGASAFCIGTTTTVSDAVGSGTWTLSNANASVSAAGVLTGVTAGIDTITYTLTNSCATVDTTTTITIDPHPTSGFILGGSHVCAGNTMTLTDAAVGGTWSASNGHATISATGVVTGVSAGVDIISYTVSNSCGTVETLLPITVNAYPVSGVVSGLSTLCQASSTTLSESVSGGVWSASNVSASVSAGGVVTGLTAGVDTISYTVTNICGTVGSSLIMNINPLPDTGTITGASPVCAGSNITLVDVAPGGTWSSSNTNATVTAGGVVTGVTAGTSQISYTVTNSCGTLNAVTTIEVDNLPAAAAIGGLTGVCTGQSITLTDDSTGGVWSVSNTGATISASGVLTGVTAGSDTVQYTITNACGTAQATMSVAINLSPVVGNITGATGLCAGSVIPLGDTTSGGSWSSSNTYVSTVGSTGLVNGIAQGIDTITYSVTNAAGCTSSVTYPDTVFAVPVVAAITGNTNICVGNSSTLSNAIAMGTWTSRTPGVATIGSSDGVLTGVSTGNTIIVYSVNNICGSVADSIIATVQNMPVAGPISGPASSVCVGSATNVYDATAGGTWSVSDTTIASINSSTGVVTGINPGSVVISYTITNSAGCSATSTFAISFGSSIGSSHIIPATAMICNGHSVTMQVITAGGGLNYQWLDNGVDISGATNYEYSTTTPGNYSAVISNGSCQETLTGPAVSVLAAPAISFDSPTITCSGVYTHYQWLRNGIVIPGATSSSYTEHAAGNYRLVVNDGDCNDTSAVYVIHATGGGGGTAVTTVNNGDISYYPNPAQSILHIQSPFEIGANILCPDGRIVIHAAGKSDIDVSGLAAGVYIIQVYDGNNRALITGKFVKE